MTRIELFPFPVARMDLFSKRLKELTRLCTRAGLPEPEIVESKPGFEETREGLVYEVVTFTVEVALDARFGDWELVAYLQHKPEGNIIDALPHWVDDLPHEYRQKDRGCDECQHNRVRHDTCVVHNWVTGEFRQLGTTCMTKVTGAGTAAAIKALARLHKAVSALKSDTGLRALPREEETNGLSTRVYLNYVALAIRTAGYRKASSGQPTKVHAMDLFRRDQKAAKDGVARLHRPSEEDRKLALQAIGWAAHLPEDGSDYEHNIRTIANSPFVDDKATGYAASIVQAYKNHLDRESRADVAENSTHIGTPGERWGAKNLPLLDVECTGIRSGRRRDGSTWAMYQFMTADDQVAVWFTGSQATGIEEGRRYAIAATVKKHEVYRGVCQTQLSRVNVAREIGESFDQDTDYTAERGSMLEVG